MSYTIDNFEILPPDQSGFSHLNIEPINPDDYPHIDFKSDMDPTPKPGNMILMFKTEIDCGGYELDLDDTPNDVIKGIRNAIRNMERFPEVPQETTGSNDDYIRWITDLAEAVADVYLPHQLHRGHTMIKIHNSLAGEPK